MEGVLNNEHVITRFKAALIILRSYIMITANQMYMPAKRRCVLEYVPAVLISKIAYDINMIVRHDNFVPVCDQRSIALFDRLVRAVIILNAVNVAEMCVSNIPVSTHLSLLLFVYGAWHRKQLLIMFIKVLWCQAP